MAKGNKDAEERQRGTAERRQAKKIGQKKRPKGKDEEE